MDAQEELIASNDHPHQIVKRKRTKRQRSTSPMGLTVTSSSSSGGCGGGATVEDYGSITSPTTGSEIYESTEEEEDMANCLIMLAQGESRPRKDVRDGRIRKEKFSSRKFAEIEGVATTDASKAGFYVYECKTCNRTFPSFQALGGHRASHKKPKQMMIEEKKESSLMALPTAAVVQEIDKESKKFSRIGPTGVLFQTPNSKVFHGTHSKGKIHECSICGSEFTSGQALGGHMRRHRASTSSSINNNNNNNNNSNSNSDQAVGVSVDTSNNTNEDPSIENVKAAAPRNILSLDLNLPAPEDDHNHSNTIESRFQFATSTQPTLVLSAPALVDCHY